MDDLIQIKRELIPHAKNMLDTNIIVDENHTLLKNTIKHNHASTAPSAQVTLGSDQLQFQYNTTTHITYQKLPPFINQYICFQTCRIMDRST